MKDWRADYPILVAEAQTIGSLAIIRSLGRAGYPVLAASQQKGALGFHSRYCGKALAHPPYRNGNEFLDWLQETLTREGVRLIIPSEGLLVAIKPRFSQFRHLLPVPTDEALVYGALSKCDLFERCVEGGLVDNLPPFRLVGDGPPPTAADLAPLGTPLFVKTDFIHARKDGGGAVIRCGTAAEATAKVAELQPDYRRILIQGYVPGVGVGAFLARWGGGHLAKFMHRRLHEVPHWGGASSFRESWRHDGILADAEARLERMGWHGVGMFEYRWERETGRFHLIEFNSRFWGSLHLALFAGVDFPRLLADAILGRPNPPVVDYAPVKCRLTFPREVEYVYSCLKDKSLPWSRRLGTVAEFATLGLDPRIHSDLSFPGDRLLYGRMMIRSIKHFLS
ncbi:MAG TPA: ATP-grasp domain-containing protein [Rhodocyclaceae bacterium]|nr:ATP-grasp domain-containing protein [Rhodocyclaceae bacterium]